MLVEKTIRLSEDADSHHVAVLQKYKDSSLANLLDQDISELMFEGKAWKQGLCNDELEQISLAVASLECELKNKSNKTYWIDCYKLWQTDDNQEEKLDSGIENMLQHLIEGAKARRNELDQVNSIFVEMWRNL